MLNVLWKIEDTEETREACFVNPDFAGAFTKRVSSITRTVEQRRDLNRGEGTALLVCPVA